MYSQIELLMGQMIMKWGAEDAAAQDHIPFP